MNRRMERFFQLDLHLHYQELCECECVIHFKSAVCVLGSPSWCKIGYRRESVLGGGAWPKKLDTFVPCFRVRALKATAWMGFLFIQCNQEAVTSTKCPSVPLSSTQRRVHFNLEDHRNGIKYAKREINSSNCTVWSLIILPSLQSKHNT